VKPKVNNDNSIISYITSSYIGRLYSECSYSICEIIVVPNIYSYIFPFLYRFYLLQSFVSSVGGLLSSSSRSDLDHASSLRMNVEDCLRKQRYSADVITG
jgi:hypothetical protein